ncbi:MAG: hypothetical protein ABR511_13130 [Acidimicrobiales bacterium]
MACRSTDETAAALISALDADDRFHRDTGLGTIYHRGKASFREVSATDSLHLVIDGNRLTAHVDRISPLKRRPDGTVRYSVARGVVHNLSGIGADLARRLTGRHGQQRCTVDCGVIWEDDEIPEGDASPPVASPPVA